MAQTTSPVMEEQKFNHFPIISLWELSVAMATKPRGKFSVAYGNHLMIITAKYGSHHFSGYGENAIKSFSHYKSMGAFC